MATIGKYGKIIFSEDDLQFIRDNFQTMTNQEIADALGLKKTRVRMKAYEMGLQRIKMEYWPEEATQFLKDHYHKIGDKEMCRIFSSKFPKEKGWTPQHIQKKMEQLGLNRNKLDWYTIKERNRRNGSFGKMNKKNNPAPPPVWVWLNKKTRVKLKPGQTAQEIIERYSNLRN